MTSHEQQTPAAATVTVPVGLGGKTTPYVADPAPTLLLELASVDTAREQAKIADQRVAAEQAAADLVAAAEAEAEEIRAAAHREAERVRAEAAADAREIETSIADRQAELDARATELDEREGDLAERESGLETARADLESREREVEARLASIDAEAAAASTLLADARRDAEEILAEASAAAETILEESHRQASEEAAGIVADARRRAEHAATEPDHTAVPEDLADREELLARIAVLEARQAGVSDAFRHREEQLLEQIALHEVRELAVIEPEVEHDETITMDESAPSGNEDAEIVAGPGRHAADGIGNPRPVTSFAPLTEQLSTSAFRATHDKDRRGRRRR